jgi:hypothetical protein
MGPGPQAVLTGYAVDRCGKTAALSEERAKLP